MEKKKIKNYDNVVSFRHVKDQIVRVMARAEMELCTVKVCQIIYRCTKKTVSMRLDSAEIEQVLNELVKTYASCEIIGEPALQTKVFSNFCDQVSKKYNVAILSSDTLAEAEIKLFEGKKQLKIAEITEELALWNITKEDLFPQYEYYGH